LNLNYLLSCLFSAACCALLILAAPDPARAAAADEAKIFSFDDQFIRIDARLLPDENKNLFGLEVRMTPQPGWKLSASNASSIKPLRLKFSLPSCLKVKGATRFSPPDLSGTDDSGSYSEYFTKTAYISQEFSRLKCAPKSGDGIATVTYLLCQDNRCVGPFSKEIRFRAPDRK
jgi:hypothetical protein